MKCIVCGKNSETEYCFIHKNRTKRLEKPTLTRKKLVNVGNSQHNKDHLLFKQIWNERVHKSEISGIYLGKEPLSIYFHHILPKNKYPEIRMDKENIILLTVDEHANVESDIYRYEKINKIREKLKTKYNIL
jgi:hypothetical protein